MSFAQGIRRRRVQAATLGASVALASFSVLRLPWSALVFGAGFVLGGLALWMEGKKLDKQESLEGVLAEAVATRATCTAEVIALNEEARKVADEALIAVIERCGGDPSTLRASVYFRNESEWRRIARYSGNAAFRDGGRATVPLGSGLLQLAFERGGAEANDLPDRSRAPAQYEREQMQLGLAVGMSAAFRMQSRSYAVFRLEGSPAERPIRTLVLCVESTGPQGVVRSALFEELAAWFPALHRAFLRIL